MNLCGSMAIWVAAGLLAAPATPQGMGDSTKADDTRTHSAEPAEHDEPHPVPCTPLRGFYFNPQVIRDSDARPDQLGGVPWLCTYPECRTQVRAALREMTEVTGGNFLAVFVSIAYALRTPSQSPRADQPLAEWANIPYLDNVAAFIDDCHDARVSVEVDLACNMWVPRSVDSEHHIANSGHWPMPDETPWDEAATWYRETIQYVEEQANHPESIAYWCMMGNYELGEAEPCLWNRDDNPAITRSTEESVKQVWPVFRSAGKRPKAPPILLPIFSNNEYWMAKSPIQRLSAFTNLQKWLVDDLGQPPDYWVMTTYPFCDPAPDGFCYLKAIVDILGRENASRIISTDLKGPGHDHETKDAIVSAAGHTGPETLEWHFRKCAEYGFGGWWIWAYQDTPMASTGIREAAGGWKRDLVEVIRRQTPTK